MARGKKRKSRKKGGAAHRAKFTRIARECMGQSAGSVSTLGGAMRAYGKCVKRKWRSR